MTGEVVQKGAAVYSLRKLAQTSAVSSTPKDQCAAHGADGCLHRVHTRTWDFQGPNMRSICFVGPNMRSICFVGPNMPSICFGVCQKWILIPVLVSQEPDKRALSRILKCLCVQYHYTGSDSAGRKVDLVFNNPYTIHGSYAMHGVVEMFKQKYYPDYIRNITENIPFAQQPPCDNQMFQDIIRVWWGCNCNSLILANRLNAKYIRRMWRNIDVA
jgi:hypothetical protein